MPEIRIQYDVFDGPEDLPEQDQVLLTEALNARRHSYSPYSNFKVGAAARLADGSIAAGWNTENAAYPMCICAEPATLAAAANLRPNMPVVAMAITVKSPSQTINQPATPCGSCRQQLTEHEQRHATKIRLILRGETGPVYVLKSASALLPFGFSADLL